MRKYTQSEGKLEVLRGQEAQVLNDHFNKLGKRKVSDFSEEEIEALEAELNAVRQEEQSNPAEEENVK